MLFIAVHIAPVLNSVYVCIKTKEQAKTNSVPMLRIAELFNLFNNNNSLSLCMTQGHREAALTTKTFISL